MSKLNRLIGMASKALGDKSPSTANSGGTDWKSMVRSAADALTGDTRTNPAAPSAPAPRTPADRPASASASAPRGPVGLTPPGASGAAMSDTDRAAIARYDYLVQTADPTQLEQIHRDAFARLTPAQRAEVEARLSDTLPPHERPRSADPSQLARAATRSEMMKPGSLRGLLGRIGGTRGGGSRGAGALAMGAGAVAAGGLLGAVAGGAVVSAVAAPLLDQAAGLVDFDALASGIDPEALAGGVGDHVSGLGDQVSGFGDQLSNFELPNLGDLFGR